MPVHIHPKSKVPAVENPLTNSTPSRRDLMKTLLTTAAVGVGGLGLMQGKAKADQRSSKSPTKRQLVLNMFVGVKAGESVKDGVVHTLFHQDGTVAGYFSTKGDRIESPLEDRRFLTYRVTGTTVLPKYNLVLSGSGLYTIDRVKQQITYEPSYYCTGMNLEEYTVINRQDSRDKRKIIITIISE